MHIVNRIITIAVIAFALLAGCDSGNTPSSPTSTMPVAGEYTAFVASYTCGPRDQSITTYYQILISFEGSAFTYTTIGDPHDTASVKVSRSGSWSCRGDSLFLVNRCSYCANSSQLPQLDGPFAITKADGHMNLNQLIRGICPWGAYVRLDRVTPLKLGRHQ